jgi:cytochrome d ubiquinol oxidase subunit I
MPRAEKGLRQSMVLVYVQRYLAETDLSYKKGMHAVNDLLFARAQMAMSLGFHIIFAVIGMAMPLLMVISEVLWLKTKDPQYLELTKRWSKGTAVMFAVGAVSGTVLSFELGLLFPTFMRHAGPLVGMPFSLEGFAFFTEAIFLGIYLYGWGKISKGLHLAAGIVVALSGALSGAFVTLVNAWMNTPEGFRLVDGKFVDIDPLEAFFTPAAPHEVIHMLVSAYMATGFAVAAVHAHALLKKRNVAFHQKALSIALFMAIPFTLVQPLVGHFAAQRIAVLQPMKLAAAEGLFETTKQAPLALGGIPNYETEKLEYALEIPKALSFLAFNDFDAEVKGLKEIPKKDWPHPIVHWAFDLMVGIGTFLAGVAVWGAWLGYKKGFQFDQKYFLRTLLVSGPLGFIAIEAGWTVTEMGRQPWVIYNVLRTADAVTPMPGIIVPFVTFSIVYLFLSVAVVTLLVRQFRATSDVILETKGDHP